VIASIITIAEYSEEPILIDGVDDTGMTLWAFLPFSSQDTRQNAEHCIGRTTVIDTRVTCQVPHLEDASIETPQGNQGLIPRGSFGATRQTPRLNNQTLQFEEVALPQDLRRIYDRIIPFVCYAPVENGGFDTSILSKRRRTSLCQMSMALAIIRCTRVV
jgi:hypothetical protein